VVDELVLEVISRFVDIDGIVDNHSLIVHFIKNKYVQVYYRLFIYLLLLEIQLSRVENLFASTHKDHILSQIRIT
jgi:hypothetical protein